MNKTQLREAILEHLKVLAAGETASSEDAALVDKIIDRVHPQLQVRGMAPFDTANIPDHYGEPLTRRIAFNVAPKFGLAQDLVEKADAERELRQLSTKPTTEPTTFSDF